LFSKGPQQHLQFEGNLLPKGPPRATEMCKYSAFKLHSRGLKESVMCKYCAWKGAPNSNCNVWASCFQRRSQQKL